MPSWVAFLEWLQKPFFAMSVAIVSFVLLIVGSDAIAWLDIGSHRSWIGVVFLCAVAITLAQTLSIAWSGFKVLLVTRLANNAARERMRKLTEDEKTVMRRYVDGNTRSQNLDLTDGTVFALFDAGIIYKAEGSIAIVPDRRPFIIRDFAWDYLNANKHLVLNLAVKTPLLGKPVGG